MNKQTEAAITEPAWSARCDCYNSHNSSSGRCNARNVTDPTATMGQPAKCERCRRECCKPEPTKPLEQWEMGGQEGFEGLMDRRAEVSPKSGGTVVEMQTPGGASPWETETEQALARRVHKLADRVAELEAVLARCEAAEADAERLAKALDRLVFVSPDHTARHLASEALAVHRAGGAR